MRTSLAQSKCKNSFTCESVQYLLCIWRTETSACYTSCGFLGLQVRSQRLGIASCSSSYQEHRDPHSRSVSFGQDVFVAVNCYNL